MTLTKEHLIRSLRKRLDLPKTKSTDHIEFFLELIKEKLEQGEDVMISGFGKFCIKEKNERRGRNPATAEPMILDSRKVVTFRCSPVLKARINREK